MLTKLVGKPVANRVIGVDTSTNGFAYAVIDNGELVEYDEIMFKGSTLHEKIAEASHVAKAIAEKEADFILVEQTIYINSYSVVVKMAYFVGVMLGAIGREGIPFDDCVPINWMKHIGNPSWTKAERAEVTKANKGKSKSWIKNKMRQMRKDRTKDIVRERFGVDIENDNIADAAGIAIYAWEVSTKRG